MSTLPIMPRAIKGRVASSDEPQERSFRALIRAMGLLDRVMQPYFTKFGLSGAKWGTLRALHRAEQEGHQALRMTELSERLLVRPPSVTGVIDRLERSGWVTRDAAPDDLRAKQVRLTSEGRKLVDRVVAVHSDQIAKVMAGLNQDEQFDLYRLLDRLCEHLEGII